MTAVGFGALAALMWGLGALISVRQVRELGPGGSLLWMMTLGLLAVSPLLAVVDVPDVSTSAWVYGALAGVGYVVGTGCWFGAVRRGRVSLVTPIVSTDGAVAAVISIAAFGESVTGGVAAALVIVVAGIVVTSLRPGAGREGGSATAAIPFALGAALGYGFSFVAAGEASDLGVVWAVWASRAAATAIVVPAALALRFVVVPSRRTLWLPFVVMLSDVLGFAAFIRGSSSSVAITSVLASQYAIVAVLGGMLAYRERLTPLQAAGIATTLVGVGVLAFVRG